MALQSNPRVIVHSSSSVLRTVPSLVRTCLMDAQGQRASRILAVTPITGYSGFNTSVHRVESFKELGFEVSVVDSTLNRLASARGLEFRIRNRLFFHGLPIALNDLQDVNRGLLRALAAAPETEILWLEKSLTVSRETLQTIRSNHPDLVIIGFSPDDMGRRHNQSRQFLSALPFYDHFITTKSYNVPELLSYGCPNVVFTDNGYDPKMFCPIEPTSEDRTLYGGEIGFIGSFEESRAMSLLKVAEAGMNVRIWGAGWEQFAQKRLPKSMVVECKTLVFDSFSRACCNFDINLNFLRKLNRDVQTTRSVEIPGTGGFMLAERTTEHERLFVPGVEADFFSSDDELVEKCKYYLKNPGLRQAIAERGLSRCSDSGYSNQSRMKTVFEKLGILS
jgi:spore maturation protein CgeB